MSDQSQQIALSLEQILLGIADSLTEAQAALKNVQPYDQYGRPNTLYELPYLDFKLQVTSEFQHVTQSQNDGSSARTAPLGKSRYPTEYIAFKPVKTNETSTIQGEIISTISGRFIANMPNQGLPQIILTIATEKLDIQGSLQKYGLDVSVSNSAGEKLVGSTVELNFDAPGSELINGLSVDTPGVDKAEDKTDAGGQVRFEISLPIQYYNQGRTFVFSVNVGPVSKEFSISKP